MSMFNKVSKSFMFGQHEVTLTTGEIARQASGAVVVQMGDTVILATVVAKKETKPGQDFFPLTASSPVASSSVKAVRPNTKPSRAV